MKRFKVDTYEAENYVIISLTGELDASSAVEADKALEDSIASGASAIMVDCRKLHYISSAGLGVIISAYQSCVSNGISFIHFGMQPKIKDVFDIIGLGNIITVVPTLEDAMQLIHS